MEAETITESNSIKEDKFDELDKLRAFIGPNNHLNYMKRFAKFESTGKIGVSWHWPALFVTLPWLLHRKMWKYAAIYFCGGFAIGIFNTLLEAVLTTIGGEDSALLIVAGLFSIVLSLAFTFGCPLYAHALYYTHAKRKIAEVSSMVKDPKRLPGELADEGGTGKAGYIAFGIMVGFSVLVVIAVGIAMATML